MGFKDHFSKQAADYAKFRPRYPREMFDYLGSISPARQLAWDCATGNGQAAVELASVFSQVIATDASESQIRNAQPHQRVEYRVAPAEESKLQSGSFALVVVAQALHWLNRDRFYPEMGRVLKKNGVFAASAYNLLRTDRPIKEIIRRYYYEHRRTILAAGASADRAVCQDPLPVSGGKNAGVRNRCGMGSGTSNGLFVVVVIHAAIRGHDKSQSA